MPKPVIAIDIDDVLSEHVPAFIRYSNEQFGLQLTAEDYDENWIKMWGVDRTEGIARNEAYHASDAIPNYAHRVEAEAVLQHLRTRFSLVVVTSRRSLLKDVTLQWIDKYYPGAFDAVHFAGMWDTITEHSNKATKAELCREIGADYLVDDQLKHCLAVADAGMQAVVFGEYPWNRTDTLPSGVTRCADWQAVQEYFDAI